MEYLTNLPDPGLREWSIYQCVHGSRAYGLDVEGSDVDVISICVPPISYYLGLERYGSDGSRHVTPDVVVYELRKYVSIAYKGNLNALEPLWTTGAQMTEAGAMLRDHRDLFVGRHVYTSIVGMAKAHGAKHQRATHPDAPNWKELMHTVRALRMGIEFLTDGELKVNRDKDRDELLAIKQGAWSIERVEAEVQRLIRAMAEAYIVSKLPDRPDVQAISKLCEEVIGCAWDTQCYLGSDSGPTGSSG